MNNVKSATQSIKRMNAICLLRVGKFSAVVRLDHFRCIPKVDDRTLHKVYRAVAAVLFVRIDEAFSAGFIYYGVLVEFHTICAHITGCRHIFHIHLPLFTQFRWRIIVPQMLGFLLGGFHLLAVSKPDKHTIQ